MLPAAEQIGDPLHPLELVVVEVTDQVQRRPTKMARLVPARSRIAVAELASPKLAWFNNDIHDRIVGSDTLCDSGAVPHAATAVLTDLSSPRRGLLCFRAQTAGWPYMTPPAPARKKRNDRVHLSTIGLKGSGAPAWRHLRDASVRHARRL